MDIQPNTAPRAEQAAQGERLRQLLRWVGVVCVVSAVAELLLGVLLPNRALLLLSGGAVLMCVATGAAYVFAQRGALHTALLLVAAAGLIVSLGVTAVVPAVMTGLIMVPLVLVLMLLPSQPLQAMPGLAVLSIVSALTIYLIGTLVPPFVTQPPQNAQIFIGGMMVVIVSGLALLLLWQYSSRLTATLLAAQSANVALYEAQAGLEQQVTARTAELRDALAEVEARAEAQAQLLAENTEQRAVIREMSVPVLPVSATTLVLPLIGALDSARLRDAQEQALTSIERSHARRLILDITGVPVVDTQVAQGLVQTVQSVRLLGAEAILVGIRPEVAQTIVGLGLTLEDIHTAADVQSALQRVGSSTTRQ